MTDTKGPHRKEIPINKLEGYAYRPPPMKDRLVVTLNVYHQTEGDEPTVVEAAHARLMDTKEQPYKRRCQVTAEWKELDCGWLGDKVGMLVLKNEEGSGLLVQPTPEEKAAVAARIIELGVSITIEEGEVVIPFATLPPGIALPVMPSDVMVYRIRCLKGPAKLSLNAFPS